MNAGVTRDRSLDEFLGGEQRDADDEPADQPDEAVADASDSDSDDESDDARDGSQADVEPAVSTYGFSPDGAPCAACGESVQKRWRDDGRLVCPDCMAW